MKKPSLFINTVTIGILTAEGKKSPLTGNLLLFKEISKRMAAMNCKVVLLTPSSLKEQKLAFGFLFNEQENQWMLIENIDKPIVIYNRVPYRKCEKTQEFKQFAQWCNKQSIPFFNRNFFTKSELFLALSKNKQLRSHLPNTEISLSNERIQKLLNSFHSIYLKPNEGSKGNGVFVLTMLNDGTLILKGHNKHYGSSSFNNLWKYKLEPMLSKNNYIAQQQIQLIKHHNRSVDFRALAHKVNHQWVLSGIGVRQQKLNGITSHVLKGGNIVKVGEVCQLDDINKIEKLTILCGNTLETEFNDIKEFSIDIGKTKDDQFYIFDINSKPMKFDEPKIFETGLSNLIRIFEEYRL